MRFVKTIAFAFLPYRQMKRRDHEGNLKHFRMDDKFPTWFSACLWTMMIYAGIVFVLGNIKLFEVLWKL